MPIIEIHGKKVEIPDESHSAHVAADFLSKYKDTAEAIFDKARHDRINGITHFEMPHSTEHINTSHHFTLIHKSDGTYELRKRHGY